MVSTFLTKYTGVRCIAVFDILDRLRSAHRQLAAWRISGLQRIESVWCEYIIEFERLMIARSYYHEGNTVFTRHPYKFM